MLKTMPVSTSSDRRDAVGAGQDHFRCRTLRHDARDVYGALLRRGTRVIFTSGAPQIFREDTPENRLLLTKPTTAACVPTSHDPERTQIKEAVDKLLAMDYPGNISVQTVAATTGLAPGKVASFFKDIALNSSSYQLYYPAGTRTLAIDRPPTKKGDPIEVPHFRRHWWFRSFLLLIPILITAAWFAAAKICGSPFQAKKFAITAALVVVAEFFALRLRTFIEEKTQGEKL